MVKLLLLLCALSGLSLVVAQPSSPPADVDIYINTGSSLAVNDSDGNVWIADNYFSSGSRTYSTDRSITGLEDLAREPIYQTERNEKDDPEDSLTYSIPVPRSGTYQVVFHWAEIYFGSPGSREFSVEIQGSQVFPFIDLYQEVGDSYKVLTRTSPEFTVATGENIEIEFISLRNRAKINAIEIHSTDGGGGSTPPSPFTPIRINAGGSQVITAGNVVWEADTGFNSGTRVYDDSEARINGLLDPSFEPLYRTERYDRFGGTNMMYSLEVPSGAYFVTLHMCELFFDQIGDRVFDVEIQGEKILDDYDIVRESGGRYNATTETFIIFVSPGEDLVIEFFDETRRPKISAIEVDSVEIEPPPTDSPPATTTTTIPPPTFPLTTTSPPPTFPLTTLTAPTGSPPPVTSPGSFAEIRINVGSSAPSFLDSQGNEWIPDAFFTGGKASSVTSYISNVFLDPLLEQVYQSDRYADNAAGESTINYEIPVLDGAFRVTLLFAEILAEIDGEGERVFDVYMEGLPLIERLDIFKETGGINIAYDEERIVEVMDGSLSIEFRSIEHNCKLNGIVVVSDGSVSPHYAHSVPHITGGTYFAIAEQNATGAVVQVDGTGSHTHRPGAVLERWTWSAVGLGVLGEGEKSDLYVSIGEWQLDLEVEDSLGDTSSTSTIVTVRAYGWPQLLSVTPLFGDVRGGENLTITGNFLSNVTAVNIGVEKRTGTEISFLNETQVEITTPPIGQPTVVDISVESSFSESNSIEFEFIDVTLPPVAWESGEVDDLGSPTTLAFGPDGRLYIGTEEGEVVRWTLDENYNVIERYNSTAVQDSESSNRVILGIVFDPNDVREYPDVYVSHSWLFHKQDVSYNGKVSKLSGPLLDQFTNIVTGIPVSDHDHGVNGMEFGDDGELYIQNGGNTNAGVKGTLSSRQQQDEDWFSAATLVARGVGTQGFDGDLTYDDNGMQTGGWSVEVFAPGMRNPFDLVLHSNGKLYGTDNGPNKKFGNESVTCTEGVAGPTESDELNLIVEGNYYGHPNRLRGGSGDGRQCTYYAPGDTGDDHTAPIAKLPSSSNGICEFQTEHFGGQLRGQLIVGKWKGPLRNVKLSTDGLSTVSGLAGFPPKLVGPGGLDVTQGPDGTLFTAGHGDSINKIFFHKPLETVAAPGLKIKSVFPRRGPRTGGSTLSIFCENLDVNGTLSVKVGGNDCLNPVASGSIITCTIPSGAGKADVVVTTGINTVDSFEGGYRYTNVLTEPIWIDLNENESYSERHECSFVQAGDKFYLLGGRENSTLLEIYDYVDDSWRLGHECPLEFNHFQAVEYEGLIWVIGSYKDNEFPNEALTEDVHVYDPASDVWMVGPPIPLARRRGGGGLQVYNDKFYLVGGNTMGHFSGYVPWLDEYDPHTGQWRQLPDAPRARDHFHAAVIEDRMYIAGGRRTARDQNNLFGDVVPEVDVFDFRSETWLPSSATPDDLPEPRAAAATAVFRSKLIIAGGESGTSDSAYDEVHELDPATGQWKVLSSLNHPRHGTQAITSGQGVYVAAGSWKQGGGNQRNMEVYNQNAPAGAASEAGSLSAPSSVDVIVGTPTAMTIQHQGDGNQGIFVTGIALEGINFAIISSILPPVLIPNGGTLDVVIEYTGMQNNEMGLLLVDYSGDEFLLINLEGSTSITSTSTTVATITESTTITSTTTPITTTESTTVTSTSTQITTTESTTVTSTSTQITTTASTTTTSTSTPSDLDIVDFVIVNAETNVDIGSVDGCSGCLTSLTLMSIRAVPHGSVGSIRLFLTGPESGSRLERYAPYSLWGDRRGDYNGELLDAGTYTISAIAFIQSDGAGASGSEARATFTVID